MAAAHKERKTSDRAREKGGRDILEEKERGGPIENNRSRTRKTGGG